jgi:hypothetical protein
MRMIFFFSLLFIRLAFSLQTVYIHIGPHKTGTTYLQNVFSLNLPKLQGKNVCVPVKNGTLPSQLAKTFSIFSREIISNISESQNSFFPSFRDCFEKNMDLLISAEALSKFDSLRVHSLKKFLDSAAHGHDYRVKVVVVYREWLVRLHSFYNFESFLSGKKVGNVNSFLEYIAFTNQEKLHREDMNLYMETWSSVFGEQNMIMIDYYGVKAAKQSFGKMFFCEVLHIFCEQPETVDDYGEVNVRGASLLSHYVNIFDNFLNSRNLRSCRLSRLYQENIIDGLANQNFALPVIKTDFSFLLKERLALNEDMFQKYQSKMIFGDKGANELVIRSFSLDFLDINALYQNISWINFMDNELKRLSTTRHLCPLN